ncbi:MAG: radical SAM protein [Nitrospirae bacterium]|nr:radical SAM protein [Nitrospirota bacterium]
MLPKTAVIAVTLNCNAKCVMCNIWKNKMRDELKPEEYLKLPSSLREINITGGEPFLRNDIEQVVGCIKQACKNARLVISSNGYLYTKIESKMKEIQKIDPKVALRISIDGLEETHNKIRGFKDGFQRGLETLRGAKKIGIKDMGISMTISSLNVSQIYDVFKLSKKLNVQMTMTAASDSDIYFGNIDEEIKRFDFEDFKHQVCMIARERTKTVKPKEWARAWFEGLLVDFVRDKKRPFGCDAGKGFFYMDSVGNVYGCHIIGNYLGNLRDYDTFKELWENEKRKDIFEKARKCKKCWMVCTAKSEISNKKLLVGLEILKKKFAG